MNSLDYKELKTEFKKKNFIRFKEIKKKRKVIDATKNAFIAKDPINDRYWDEIVKRADNYKKSPEESGPKL